MYEIPVDFVETTSMAFVVRIGSVHESDSKAGVAHFLEHVVFRGTKSYSMKELKLAIEGVGGTLNAFTGRLSTVYYAKVPSFQSVEAMRVLYSLVEEPLIREEDVEIERKIILEEYRMSLDVPEERLHNLALRSVWGFPYGRDIIGEEGTINSLTREDLVEFHRKGYVDSKIKLVLAGDLKRLGNNLEEVAKSFRRNGKFPDPSEPTFRYPEEKTLENMRDLKHVHVLLVREAPGRLSEDFLRLVVLNTMLGSGMSSYLFEEIREKNGLVYDVFTEVLPLKSTGLFGIYFSTSPDRVSETLNTLVDSLKRFDVRDYYDYGIKRYLGKLMMLLESPGGMMTYVVDRLSLGCDVRDFKEHEEQIRSITLNEMVDFSERMLEGKWAVFTVAPEGFDWDVGEVIV